MSSYLKWCTGLVALILPFLAYQVPFIYRIQAGPGDHVYLSDFWALESNARDGYWRWSQDDSGIVFHNAGQIFPAGRTFILELTAASARPSDGDLPEVVLTFRGAQEQIIGTTSAKSISTTYKLPIHPDPADDGDWTLLIHSETFQPAGDPRALGILFKRATLRVEDTGLPVIPRFPTLLYAIVSPFLLLLAARELGKGPSWFVYGLAFAESLLIASGLALMREAAVFYLPLLFFISLVPAAWPFMLRQRARLGKLLHGHGTVLGLGLVVIGEGAVWLSNQTTLGAMLLCLGAALLFISIRREPESDPSQSIKPNAIERWEWLALIGITMLAFVLRVYRLDDIFFGLHRDETRFGLLAWHVLTDPAYRPLYEGPPINQSGVFLYLLAGVFKLFGVSIFSLRLLGAVSGALVVPVTWWLAREWFNEARLAFLAAFGMAVASLHIYYSRIAWPYVQSPLLAIPVYIFLARGLRNGRVRDYALAGFFLAFAQYFSQLSRVAILVAAFLILDEIIIRRAQPRNWRRGLVSGGLVALLVLAPLLFFVFKQPEVFFARTNQVAIWTDDFSFGKYPAQLLWENILAYAGMFNLSGDAHGNRVLPARPEADPFFAGLFIVGLILALSRWRDQPARRVLVWYGLAFVPGLVTLEAPAPTRVLEALSPMLVLAGWSAIQMGELIPVSLNSSRTLIRRGLFVTICIAALVLNTTRYFSDTATDVRLLRSNQLISSAVGRTLSEWRAEGRIRAGASVYAPASLLTPDDRDVLELLTGQSLTITPVTEAPSPLPAQTVLIRPNNAGLANLLAQRDPRYRADASQALDKDQRDWLAIQTLMGARPFVQFEGPPFPRSGEPAFWFYTIAQGP